MVEIVVCEGVLSGHAEALASALGATYVDPFTSTDASTYTYDALAGAFGDERVVAVGGSLGSAVALARATRQPERTAALVLLHPVVLYGRRAELVDLAAAIRWRGLAAVWGSLFGDGCEVPRHDAPVVAAALEGLGADVLLEGPDDLAAVDAPTLLVARAGDALHAMEVATAYWRTIPTTRMVNEVPGDVALWDRPVDLAARIVSFLREVRA